MIQIDVSIMGQSYKLACSEGKEAELQQAVAYLNEKMCSLRDSGKVKGNDRIAIMAALGVTVELMATKIPMGASTSATMAEASQQISAMHGLLDGALIA